MYEVTSFSEKNTQSVSATPCLYVSMVSGVRVVTLVKGVAVQADRRRASLYYRWLITIIVDYNDYKRFYSTLNGKRARKKWSECATQRQGIIGLG